MDGPIYEQQSRMPWTSICIYIETVVGTLPIWQCFTYQFCCVGRAMFQSAVLSASSETVTTIPYRRPLSKVRSKRPVSCSLLQYVSQAISFGINWLLYRLLVQIHRLISYPRFPFCIHFITAVECDFPHVKFQYYTHHGCQWCTWKGRRIKRMLHSPAQGTKSQMSRSSWRQLEQHLW